MVRNLEELCNFVVFNSGAESFGNSSIFAFSLLLLALFQNYNVAFQDCNEKSTVPFVNAIVALLYCVYLMQILHNILLDLCEYLMMQSSLWQMVRIRTSKDRILDIPEGSAERGHGQVPRGNAPPPPPRPPISLEMLLATQNDLMRRLIENDKRRRAERSQPRHHDRDSLYLDFLATHPLVFSDATDPLEADN
jgi:hypothetical protein